MAKRITDPSALNALRDKAQSDMDLRSGPKELRITVHMGTCGIAAGARDVLGLLMHELQQAQAHNVSLRQSGCAGLCDQEPMLTLTDASGKDYRYGKLDKNKVHQIIQEHVLGGNPVTQLFIRA